MRTQQELLLELLLLRARYSPEDFSSVAEVLSKAHEYKELQKILTLLAALQIGPSGKVKTTQSQQSPNIPRTLKSDDPQLFEALTQFQTRLLARDVLPEISDLRRLGEALGIKSLPGGRREQMVRAILDVIMAIPRDKAISIIEQEMALSKVHNSPFGELADTILKRN